MSPNPQSLVPNPELDALVRRVDEDRWLASRFAPAAARDKLIALYAVNYEIARTSEVVREPGIGAIRLAWWRDALAELAEGKPVRAHPAMAAMQTSWGARVDAAAFAEIVEARSHDLDDTPFENETALEAYIDATAGAVMRLACEACAPGDGAEVARLAGRAWGYAGLARAGRKGVAGVDLTARAEAAYAHVRARALPSAVFPALGYVALVPAYLRALRARRGEPSLLARQWTLVVASATGRV